MIHVQAEINETENKNMIEMWIFEKINKVEKLIIK